MKAIFLFSLLLLSNSLKAQTGGILVKCLNKQNNQAVQGLEIQTWKDSICADGTTSSQGEVFLRGLPIGENKIWIQNADLSQTLQGTIFIQENQVAQITFLIDSLFTTLDTKFDGNRYQVDAKGQLKIGNQTDSYNINLPMSNVQELHCVMVVVYSQRLNFSNSSSGCTVTRDDISRLPVRSASSIISTVGGVNSNEDYSQIHMRGSRTNDVAYYLDGMRITNANDIPKSYIGSVTTRLGGVPANYGDFTGGVVTIESRSLKYTNSYSDNYTTKYPRKEKRIVEPPVFNYDHFSPIYENDFLSPLTHPHSTFGIDVDQASWNFIKTQLKQGGTISRDAVKLEEMINSFQTKTLQVPENEIIHLEMERNICSWNSDHELITIHLKAKDLPKNLPRKAHNFVFLIDVSGSMSSSNKLPLLVEGLKNFIQTLSPNDRVAIVTYAGSSGVVLQPTLCENIKVIVEALDGLISGGSTNGIGGIEEAYRLAQKNYDPNLNNRIILATDGDFNVGINSIGDLENYISQQRGKGIYLTALGFGMGNYKNSILETLADRGDGNHFYINTLNDAKKVLSNDIGNLINIARDVKLNVEFNPNLVSSYRLIGYENRLMKPKDFMDDSKDGGEMGYGHTVTAVYEIERGKAQNLETHFVQSTGSEENLELAFVKLRYKAFEDSSSVEKRIVLMSNSLVKENEFLNLIIPFGLYLRNSVFKGSTSIELLKNLARDFHAQTEEEIELKQIILKL